MTEKRFTVPHKYLYSHSKIQLDGEPLTNNGLVRILNINDGAFLENFNLREENKTLKNENEQLKTTIQQLRTDNTKQKKLLNETMKQNKHTTTTIKTMMENERTELGRSVLRQLWEAIQ